MNGIRTRTALAARTLLRPPAMWEACLLCGGAGLAAYLAIPAVRGEAVLISALAGGGVIALTAGTLAQREPARTPWRLLAIGFAVYWIAGLLSPGAPQLLHGDAALGSPGESLRLAAYVPLLAGLLLIVRLRNPHGDRKGLIDAAIMGLGLSMLAWVLLISPYLHDPTMGPLAKSVSVAHPIVGIVLASGVLRLALDGGARPPAYYLLAASILCLLAGDALRAVLMLHGGQGVTLIEACRASCELLAAAAVLHPSLPELQKRATEGEGKLTPVRLSFLAGSVIAPMSILVRELHRIEMDLVVIICASLVLFGFVVLRMVDLMREQERSVANERLLHTCGAELVSCATQGQMQRAVLDALGGLLQGHGAGVLCWSSEGSLEAVARDGDRHWQPRSLPGAEARELLALAAQDRAQRTSLAPELLACLELPAEWVCGLTLPLPLRDGLAGLLLIASPRQAEGEQRRAVEGLATQLALALEAARRTEAIHRQHSEERFASLVRHASDLITVVGPDGSITYQSPSSERVLGYPAYELLGTRFDRLVVEEASGHLLSLLADGSGYARPDSEAIECALRHRDGGTRYFEILHTNLVDDEQVHGIVLNARDISERKAFEEQLAHQAFHDTVTNLPNRALFVERLRHAITRARREKRELAVIFLDVDDFKTINDGLGHGAGDAVLIEVAKRLSASIRASDTAARFGGDEFLVLLEDLEARGTVVEVAERIIEELRKPLSVAGKELGVRASIGISILEADSPVGADELIRDADAAMYVAKRDGKGGYRMFEPAMHDGVLARLELRADLQRALDRGQLELHYQPIVRLADGSIAGTEALLRWNHPERGLVLPERFIQIAEETGLIVPIGRWVLHEACRMAVQMGETQGPEASLYMCVNVSVRQLQHGEVVGDVRDALQDSGLEPERLTLEITESMLMSDPEGAAATLCELRDLGVRIAMDDFGTGYSSLGYLSRFPVDVIKMDRSFMGRESPEALELSSAVVAMGGSLAVEVVAEGVEREEQLRRLRDLGCEFGQGFHFARPMDSEQLLAYLAPRGVAPTRALKQLLS